MCSIREGLYRLQWQRQWMLTKQSQQTVVGLINKGKIHIMLQLLFAWAWLQVFNKCNGVPLPAGDHLSCRASQLFPPCSFLTYSGKEHTRCIFMCVPIQFRQCLGKKSFTLMEFYGKTRIKKFTTASGSSPAFTVALLAIPNYLLSLKLDFFI